MTKKNILNSKIIVVAVFILAFVPTFILCMDIVESRGTHFYNIIIAFLLFLGIFYFVYFISFLIEVSLVKLLHIVDIKYFVVYPFTYDGKLRIHPIKLLYNIECFRDSLPMNLVQFYKTDDTKLKFNKINFIRMLSLLFGFLIVAIIIQRVVMIPFHIPFTISFLCLYLATYLNWGTWKGNNFLTKHYSIMDYFVLESKLRELSSEEYIQYIGIAIKQNDREKLIIAIVKYLNQCLYDNETKLPSAELYAIVDIHLKSTYMEKYVPGSNEVYVMHAIKMIGIVGVLLNNESYKEIAIKKIKEIKTDVINQNIYGIYNKVIVEFDNYINFIIGNNKVLNYKHHLILNKDSIFSHQDISEEKILRKLNVF